MKSNSDKLLALMNSQQMFEVLIFLLKKFLLNSFTEFQKHK